MGEIEIGPAKKHCWLHVVPAIHRRTRWTVPPSSVGNFGPFKQRYPSDQIGDAKDAHTDAPGARGPAQHPLPGSGFARMRWHSRLQRWVIFASQVAMPPAVGLPRLVVDLGTHAERVCLSPSLVRDSIVARPAARGQNLPSRDTDDQTACAFCVRLPTGLRDNPRCIAIGLAQLRATIGRHLVIAERRKL